MKGATLGNELPPIPIMTCWEPGPVNGKDIVESDLIECGDRFLVLVHCRSQYKNGKDFWDAHVIVATETGWDDADGDSWSAWDWSDVSWFLRLTRDNMPQQ